MMPPTQTPFTCLSKAVQFTCKNGMCPLSLTMWDSLYVTTFCRRKYSRWSSWSVMIYSGAKSPMRAESISVFTNRVPGSPWSCRVMQDSAGTAANGLTSAAMTDFGPVWYMLPGACTTQHVRTYVTCGWTQHCNLKGRASSLSGQAALCVVFPSDLVVARWLFFYATSRLRVYFPRGAPCI
jgi:hypothetical protein